MERHLSGRGFFVGAGPTVADIALYVYPYLCTEGGYDTESFPNVRSWLNQRATLPGYVPLEKPG